MTAIFIISVYAVPFSYNVIVMNNDLSVSWRRKTAINLSKLKPDYVFIGSSRFYRGVNLEVLSSPSFILSIPSADMFNIYRLLKSNWDRIKYAHKIFIELSPEMFILDPFAAHTSFDLLLDQNVSLGFYERLGRAIDNFGVRAFMPHIQKLRLIPSHIESLIENKPFSKETELNNYGFYPTKSVLRSQDVHVEIQNAIDFVKKNYDRTLFQKNFTAYVELKDFLEKEKVNYQFIQMPNYRGYEEKLYLEYQELENKFLEIKAKNSKVVEFENKEFKLSDFADAIHLNILGARKLTENLLDL